MRFSITGEKLLCAKSPAETVWSTILKDFVLQKDCGDKLEHDSEKKPFQKICSGNLEHDHCADQCSKLPKMKIWSTRSYQYSKRLPQKRNTSLLRQPIYLSSKLSLCDRYILTYEAVERAVDLCIFMSDEPLVDCC